MAERTINTSQSHKTDIRRNALNTGAFVFFRLKVFKGSFHSLWGTISQKLPKKISVLIFKQNSYGKLQCQ